MTRRNQILAGVLLLQLVLVGWMFWPRKATTAGAGKSLFPGIEADRIVKLIVHDAQGESVELARQPSGWVLSGADDFPCTQDKVSTFLTKLLALKTDRMVTQTSSSHKQLKVADGAFERLVEFELTDGTSHKLYLGTSAGTQSSHMRADTANEVYLSQNLSAYEVGAYATAWIDANYLSVPQDQIAVLTLENANGRLQFTRISTDTWTLLGLGAAEKVDQNQVLSLVSRASSVSMDKPLGKQDKPEYGLGKPSAVVTLQTQGEQGKTYTLSVGAKDATDSSYVVKSSESAYYVRVSEWTVTDLVEKARSGVLQQPPTPEPTLAP
jgi:hypothetical protein